MKGKSLYLITLKALKLTILPEKFCTVIDGSLSIFKVKLFSCFDFNV